MKAQVTRALKTTLAAALCTGMISGSAYACTTIYVGSGLTDDGTTIYGRSEDYSNSQNKLFYVSPAGNHTAGEVYDGCYGFQWTFTHDSYSYTAFRDDNGEAVDFVCPDCGGTHTHTPYEAAGTNEKGVTVTATETLHGSDVMEGADPYEDAGIEEAEIPTVLLSEAATAREALDILTGIYDTAGANAGSGIIIGDKDETWYIENLSGHQYIALRLPESLVFVQPNMSVIGSIDLDDAENVVASEGLISAAVDAGVFVGNADENVIAFTASYYGESTPNARMTDALAYLDPASYAEEGSVSSDAYFITNVAEDGSIVPMTTNINLDRPYGIADVQNFYHIPSIGYVRNLETHIFQVGPDDSATNTVEWAAMNDTALGVFVPYYPMLTTDTAAPYQLSTAEAAFVTEAPEGQLSYPTTVNQRIDGERVAVDGFRVFPENWADSMYWSFDVISNLVMYGGLDEAVVADTYKAIYDKQAEVNSAFAALDADGITAEAATTFSKETAEDVYAFAVSLANELSAE